MENADLICLKETMKKNIISTKFIKYYNICQKLVI